MAKFRGCPNDPTGKLAMEDPVQFRSDRDSWVLRATSQGSPVLTSQDQNPTLVSISPAEFYYISTTGPGVMAVLDARTLLPRLALRSLATPLGYAGQHPAHHAR